MLYGHPFHQWLLSMLLACTKEIKLAKFQSLLSSFFFQILTGGFNEEIKQKSLVCHLLEFMINFKFIMFLFHTYPFYKECTSCLLFCSLKLMFALWYTSKKGIIIIELFKVNSVNGASQEAKFLASNQSLASNNKKQCNKLLFPCWHDCFKQSLFCTSYSTWVIFLLDI